MKRNLILFIFLILSFSCAYKKTEDIKSKISFPLDREIKTLDPANSYDAISAWPVYQGLEQLYQYHYLKRPYQIIPLLAIDLPIISDGGKTYTIEIKKGIPYHPSKLLASKEDPEGKNFRDLRAVDFINAIKRVAFRPTRSQGAWAFEGKILGFKAFRKQAGSDIKKFYSLSIEGLKATDNYTLEIKLKRPYPQLIFALAMSFVSPLPEEAIRAANNDFSSTMLGTGPFFLEEWNRGKSLVMKRFKDYHRGHQETYPAEGDRLAHEKNLLIDAGKNIPFIDTIEFKVIKEDQTRWLQFMNGGIDLIILPRDNFSAAISPEGALKKELTLKGISLEESPTLTYYWLGINMKDPLFKDNLNLRKAFAHAINRDRLIKLFTNNLALKANSIYPPGIFGYRPQHQLPFSYDLEKAKKFLKEAGYPEGKGLPEITFDTRANTTFHRQLGDYIKSSLAKIGVQVKVQINTYPHFLQKSNDGVIQFMLDGWALDYPDAENVLQVLSSASLPPGPNACNFSDPNFDKLYEQVAKLPFQAPEKLKLMEEMETIVENTLPWIMLYYERRFILVSKRLKNYRYSDMVKNPLKYFRLQ